MATDPVTTETDDDVLLLLNEAISLGRRDGMAGQHLSAMCTARDEIERLRTALMEIVKATDAGAYFTAKRAAGLAIGVESHNE